VAALVAAMAHAAVDAPVCNVCTGRATTVLDLAETIADILGVAAETGHGPPRAGEIRHSLGDPAKAWRLLGFRAATDLRTGLAATLGEAPAVRRIAAAAAAAAPVPELASADYGGAT
jgi:UDP-glucose 4-epimerase